MYDVLEEDRTNTNYYILNRSRSKYKNDEKRKRKDRTILSTSNERNEKKKRKTIHTGKSKSDPNILHISKHFPPYGSHLHMKSSF